MKRSCYQEDSLGLILDVRVQPRASREAVDGEVEGRLRIRLTAPPVDDAANLALVEFLAGRFGVASSAVTLIAGHRAREKRVRVRGDAAALVARLAGWLSG